MEKKWRASERAFKNQKKEIDFGKAKLKKQVKTTMKKQRIIVGSIAKIDLGNGYHSYARILEKSSCAVYAIKTKEELNLKTIITSPILFIVAVFDFIIKDREWEIIGKIPLEDELKVLPMEFIQDDFDSEDISLYNPNSGEITPSSKEKCQGLERASVWDGPHVVDRINDHFSGKINKWIEPLKI